MLVLAPAIGEQAGDGRYGEPSLPDELDRFCRNGLYGSNDFSVKVSSDSGQWQEAIKIDHATGNVAIGSVWPQTKLHVDDPIRPACYTAAALPSAGSTGAGALVFVINAPSGAEMAYSDGTNWRSIRSGTIIA